MSRHHDKIKNDPRWKAARAAAVERDGWTCVRCDRHRDELVPRIAGMTGLQVDHIIRISDGGEPFALDNLQTLCEDCHEEKEKEYDARAHIRISWVNPRYPELGIHIEQIESDDEEKETEDDFIL